MAAITAFPHKSESHKDAENHRERKEEEEPDEQEEDLALDVDQGRVLEQVHAFYSCGEGGVSNFPVWKDAL